MEAFLIFLFYLRAKITVINYRKVVKIDSGRGLHRGETTPLLNRKTKNLDFDSDLTICRLVKYIHE